MRLVWGTVTDVVEAVPGLQRLEVASDDGERGPALSYPQLAGVCVPGDRVLLNTTAVGLGLGTGGSHFVVARANASAEGVARDSASGGHIMKLRYTPLQVDVLSVEEQGSPHHAVMAAAGSLEGLPVACCGLHSQVPLVAAAVKQESPSARVVYVMTDDAALPLALSAVVREARDAALLDATVTCGQSFGGDLEAVNLYSGLLAARHVAGATVAIVAIGPGVAGTATPFGHGGVAQGEAINAASSLGGRPVAVLRLSFADERARHRVVSHHSLSALGQVALAAATVAVPRLPAAEAAAVDDALEASGIWKRHERGDAEGSPPDMRGMSVRTMGRGEREDPAFFAAAWAAGEVCARMADVRPEG